MCVCVYKYMYIILYVCVCVCIYIYTHSWLGNPMDKGAWEAAILRVSRVGHNSVTKTPHIYILYQIFYIHLSVDGHLDCFHVLATVNSWAMILWTLVE